MKKITILILFILCNLSCKAQTIIPTEEVMKYMDSNKPFPKGSYLKDVNHLLDKFIGTWKGTYDGKNYEFKVLKITVDLGRLTEEKLVMRYLITNSNGTVIEDTRTLPDSSPYVIRGYYLEEDTYFLTYNSKNAKCGQKGTLLIDFLKDNSNTKMNLFFSPSREIIYENDCSGFKQIMPLTETVLTKQY